METGRRSQKWWSYLKIRERAARYAGWQFVFALAVLPVAWYLSWATSWFHWMVNREDGGQDDVLVFALLVGTLGAVGLFTRWLNWHDGWTEAKRTFQERTVLDYLNESQQRDFVHRTIKALLDDWNEDPGDHRLFAADFEELWQRRFSE